MQSEYPLAKTPFNWAWILPIVALFVVFYCFYALVSSILTDESTGILYISSSDNRASITISQPDHQALNVGIGSLKLRLAPGQYQVSASNDGYQTFGTASVLKKHQSTVRLDLVTSRLSTGSSSLYSQLPVTGPANLYQISVAKQAVKNGPPEVVVITASSPSTRQDALQWIRYQGYDVSDYKIEFVNAAINNSHPYAN